MTDIFERIEKHSGGLLGQYAAKAFGYYMFPKLDSGYYDGDEGYIVDMVIE